MCQIMYVMQIHTRKQISNMNAYTHAKYINLHRCAYRVAKISRLLNIIGLFCRIQVSFVRLFCKRDLCFWGAY